MRKLFLITLFLLTLFIIPVKCETNFSIGIYYIYTESNYNENWRVLVDHGMEYALPRLNDFFSKYNTKWTYIKIREVKIYYTLKSDQYGNLPSGLYKTVPIIYDEYPNFKKDFVNYDLLILLYAGDFKGAYSYDYSSPIYASEGMFKNEDDLNTLIEHEILHTYGLPDHNWPHEKSYYNNCIMGNLQLGEIKLCQECNNRFSISNYKKDSLENLGIASTEPSSPQIDPNTQSPKEGIIMPKPLFNVKLLYFTIPILFMIIIWVTRRK